MNENYKTIGSFFYSDIFSWNVMFSQKIIFFFIIIDKKIESNTTRYWLIYTYLNKY